MCQCNYLIGFAFHQAGLFRFIVVTLKKKQQGYRVSAGYSKRHAQYTTNAHVVGLTVDRQRQQSGQQSRVVVQLLPRLTINFSSYSPRDGVQTTGDGVEGSFPGFVNLANLVSVPPAGHARGVQTTADRYCECL